MIETNLDFFQYLSVLAIIIAFGFWFVRDRKALFSKKHCVAFGKSFLWEILALAGCVLVVFLVSRVLDFFSLKYPGCVIVPVMVFLWIILHGIYAPLWFIKSFDALGDILAFVLVVIGFSAVAYVWVVCVVFNTTTIFGALFWGGLAAWGAEWVGYRAHGMVYNAGKAACQRYPKK